MLNYLQNTVNDRSILGTEITRLSQHSLKKTLLQIPVTIEKIKESPNIQFILGNAILINGIEFLLPFVGYHAGKQFVVKLIQNTYPTQQNEEAIAQWVSNTLDLTVYPIILYRSKLKNLVFNFVASIGASIKLNDEFSDRVQRAPFCQASPPSFEHFLKQISLELHYVYGTGALAIIKPYIRQIPYGGGAINLILNSYWLGVMLFQYPLSRNGVCAEHQIAILTQNRSLVFMHGLMLFIASTVLISIATLMTQGIIAEDVISSAITNLLMPLFLVHTHLVDLPNMSEERLNSRWDPIVLLWFFSTYLTGIICGVLLFVIRKKREYQTVLTNNQDLFSRITDVELLKSVGHFTKQLFVPTTLQTFHAFSQSDAARPYLILFLTQLENRLDNIQSLNEDPRIKLTYMVLKIPLLGSFISRCAALFVNMRMGVPSDLTNQLIKTILALNINDNLPRLQASIKQTQSRSIEHHQKQQHNWMRFFNIGSQTPPTWFDTETFVTVPSSALTDPSCSTSQPITTSSFETIESENDEPNSRLFNPEPPMLDGFLTID